MNLADLSLARSTSSVAVRKGRRSRISLLAALFTATALAACGGDSTSQPDGTDGETAEARVLRPGQVRDLSASGAAANSVTLRFTEVSDGVGQPASYEIRYRTTPMGTQWRSATRVAHGTCAFPLAGSAIGTVRSCTVAGLNPNTSYDFQVMAYRVFGTSTISGQLSNIVTQRTTASNAGPALISAETGNGQVGEVGTPLAQPLAVKVKDAEGRALSNVTVTWSVSGGGGSVSSSTSRTDAEGYARITRVLGIVIGQNRTTAFVSGLSPVEFAADAVAGPPSSLTVSPAEVSLVRGESAAMVVDVTDRYGNPVRGLAITWSSSDPAVASVDASGRVDARGAGTAGVTASTQTAAGVVLSTSTAAGAVSGSGNGLVAASPGGPAASAHLAPTVGVSTVRVMDGSLYAASVALAGGNGQTGLVGQALDQAFTVVVRDQFGNPMGNVPVTWAVTSGGGTLAESSSRSGDDGRAQTRLTLGTTAGSNTVRATVQGVPSVSFSATGQAGPAASVGVTPGTSSVAVGGTVQFTATIRDQYGNTVSGTPTWSSATTSVATVNSSGLATGVAAGTSQIRAAFSGFTGSSTLTVTSGTTTTTNPATVTNLQVASTTASGVTLSFSSVNDGTGSPARYQIRYAVTPLGWGWGSATPVAEGTCAGQVQGGAIGTMVTCTVLGLQAATSYDFQLVSYRGTIDGTAVFGNLSNVATGVTGASSPTASGTLAISPRGGTLTSIGATLQLSVTALSGSGTALSSPGATWTSSNTNVATVDASGRVTARGLGTAIISVAASCCTMDQVSVSVTQQIASVAVTPGTASVVAGSGTQLQAVARDANGNTISGVTFNWSSSNTWVASVNGSGWVSGSNAGSANVTAAAGGRSASAAVSVTTSESGTSQSPSHGFTNVPAGLVQRTHARWGTGGMPSGWNTVARQGTIRQGADATSPTGGSLEMRYNAGHPDGHEAGVAWWSGSFSGADEVFIGVRMKYSSNWVTHDNQVKLHLFNSGAGWLGIFDGCHNNRVSQWKIGSRGLSPVPRPSAEDCWHNNAAASPTYAAGSWVRQELYLRRSTGTVMLWVNGTLVAEHHNVDPVRTLNLAEFQHAGTWGGGGASVPHQQSIFIAETLISTR